MERRHGAEKWLTWWPEWPVYFPATCVLLNTRKDIYMTPMSLKIIPDQNAIETIRNIATIGGKMKDMAETLKCSHRTICTWTIGEEFPEVRAAYMAGKQAYAESLAEDLMEQAQSPLHDDPKLASAEVQRRRLIVDTTKWITGKFFPRVYGDNQRVDHNHSGTVAISPLAQLRQLEHAPVIDVTPSPLPPLPPPTEDDCY
jgi:hypothetical protein